MFQTFFIGESKVDKFWKLMNVKMINIKRHD